MKDYYHRLDLPATATNREIEAELPTLDHAVSRRNARFVLLDPERRAIYDQCHRSLRQIAFLRANLGLNRSPFWLVSDVDDFTTEPFARRSSRPRASLTKPLLLLLVLLLAVWGGIELFTPGPPSFEPAEERIEPSPDASRADQVAQSVAPEKSDRSPVDLGDWLDDFRPEIAPVRKAWRDLTSGLDQRSFELAESRCRGLQRAVQRCDRDELLPSPDLELDQGIHRFLEHLAGAARACRSQRYFEMTEELDGAQENWDRIERRLRYQGLEP